MEDIRAKCNWIVEILSKAYSKNQTFGHYNELILEGDDFFDLNDWRLMFKTVPRLRKALIISLVLKFITRIFKLKKITEPGLKSIKFTPGKRYNFYHRCIYGDLLIIESCVFAARELGLSSAVQAEINKIAASYLGIIVPDGREITNHSGETIYKYSYYPQTKHLVPDNHPMYKSFDRWDITVPDNDTTYLAYTCFQTLKDSLGVDIDKLNIHNKAPHLFIEHLMDHVRHDGVYGKGRLSSETGVLKHHKAVLTWTMDEHNELDPTININLLSYLSMLVYQGVEDERITYLSNIILLFLHDLTKKELFLTPKIQSYFPVGSVYFIWYRFLLYISRFNPDNLKTFDSKNLIPQISLHLKEQALPLSSFLSDKYNDNDRIHMSPFLIKEGGIQPEVWENYFIPLLDNKYFEENFYHFTHLRYPSKVICTINMLPFSAYLYSFMELFRIKHGTHPYNIF